MKKYFIRFDSESTLTPFIVVSADNGAEQSSLRRRLDGSYEEVIHGPCTEADFFETKEAAQGVLNEIRENFEVGYSDSAEVVECEYSKTDPKNYFEVVKYNRKGTLKGTCSGFTCTAWFNRFDTEEEAQKKSSELNELEGYDPDNSTEETLYCPREAQGDGPAIVKITIKTNKVSTLK